jgi:hypothetical protein
VVAATGRDDLVLSVAGYLHCLLASICGQPGQSLRAVRSGQRGKKGWRKRGGMEGALMCLAKDGC